DSDDIDAAFEELDARYLAGEAAPYARVWQSATDILNAVNRHERGPAVADLAYTDHRRIPFVDTDFGRAVSELWDLVPDARYRVTTVHALAAHAVVASIVIEGTDVHGSELQWARTILFVADGQRLEVFEEDDVDVALRRFEELRPRAKQLANASSRAYDHQKAAFAARDWDALAAILAEEVCHDDRRRVVNSGVRRGRDAVTEEIAGILEIGVKSVTTDTIATRGENLVLSRAQTWGRDQGPEAFHTDVVDVVETDAEGRIVARVVFDPDDIDAAFEELDSRYLVAEAAPYAHTWSLIARAYAGFNRREIPAHTKDWVNIDHRHAAAMAPGEGVAYFHASWELAADLNVYIEAVHRLSDRGAVFTHAGKGISREGFEAEWRTVDVVTVEGDLVSRVELFDEADVDDALARFDELQPQTRRLENAASRVTERYWANFATRDWDAIADMLPDSFSSDDRRRMVGAGVRRGRDAEVADLRAIADLGLTNVTSTIIATRGQSLILGHARFSGPADRPETAVTEILGVIEVDADQQITATVVFDPDDIDAAFDELDARYLSGEAAPYAHTWSAITAAYWAVNRREPFATTPDWVNVDHRRGIAFAPGQMIENMRAQWDLTSHISYYVEAVHRLRDLGAVVTRAADGTSREGFDAEWRVIDVLAFEGDMVRSCETFDEADLDAALAKFDGLGRGVPRLENAASQVVGRYQAHFAARDWNAMEQLVADDMSTEDRRRIVNGGVLRGRDIEIANVRTLAELGGESITSTVLATRGDRLVLACTTFSSREWPDSFEIVDVVEINPDNQLIAHVMFDANDIGAAFEELDTRYLAGETAAQSHTWSVITQAYAALNRRQLPATTPDWVNVDHRRFGTVETNGLTANIRAWWDLTSEATMRIEAVLRLSDFGAVVVHATQAAWQEGVEIESREVSLLTVTGEKLNRCEIFDEADADAALTRFDELHSQGCRLENAASQKWGRLTASFAARDWADIADTLADDFCSDDRRRIVNAGIRRGRDTNIADTRAVAEVGVTNIPFAVIATRGDRLALLRSRLSGRDPRPEAYHDEVFQVVEVNADNRIATVATFDGDDIDAAFAELNARYLAGEAAAHAHAWSVIAGTYAAFNRHELPTAAWFNVDHRRGTPFASSNLMEFIRGVWEVTPDLRIHIEAVHRLSDFGAVVTHSSCGTSREGFHAEWRMIQLLTVEGDRVSRCELFDETDLDAALARFEELQSQPRLNNAASRV
ncbi:MAG: nuclear transport factor 2 family protein, partial [Ilumatobacteraceae bacterium]